MAHYVLHFPEQNQPAEPLLERFGLGALLTDGGQEWRPETGHDGKAGALVLWHVGKPDGGALDKVPYNWRPLPGNASGRNEGDVWLGVEVERPLVPKDILRPHGAFVRGYDWELNDGQTWHLPALCNLPHVHGLNRFGQYERKVVEELAALWEMSREYAAQYFEAFGMLEEAKKVNPTPPDVEFDCEDGYDFCCKCLALNYRLTPEIISVLGLVGDRAFQNIIAAAVDLPVLLKLNDKKKDSITIPVAC